MEDLELGTGSSLTAADLLHLQADNGSILAATGVSLQSGTAGMELQGTDILFAGGNTLTTSGGSLKPDRQPRYRL